MRTGLASLLGRLLRGPWTPLRLTGVTFGLMTIVAAITFGGRFYTYTQDDPNFCRSCHTMEKAWERWQTSEHKNITCHSCHEANPADSAEQIIKYVLNRPDEVRQHAGINDESCEKCHASKNVGNWKQIANTAGHKVHVDEERLACTKCHAISVHRFAPPALVCLSCHGEQSVKMTKMAERYCLDCHEYLAENSPLKPTRQTCLDCHEKQAGSKVHWPANAPMQFQCSQCHKPHEKVAPQAGCQSCHQDIKQTALHARQTHANTDCTACHQPHEWQVSSRESCLSCHANKVEHNQAVSCENCHNFKKPKAGT